MITETKLDEPFHIELVPELQEPMTKIGICVNKELREYLFKYEISNAAVGIIVTKDGKEMFRKSFALTDGFTYLSYPGHGDFVVEAIVAWANPDVSVRNVKQALLSPAQVVSDYGFTEEYRKDGWGRYSYSSHDTVFNDETEKYQRKLNSFFEAKVGFPSSTKTFSVYKHVSLGQVTVSPDFFAKPPSKATMAWIGTFFEAKGDDQCDTRKRKIGSALRTIVQPISYLIKAIGIILAFYTGFVYENGFKHAWKPGKRGGWNRVFAPIREDRNFLAYKQIKNEKGNIEGYEDRNLAFSIISFFALILFPIFVVASAWVDLDHGLKVVGIFIIAIIALIIFALIAFGIGILIEDRYTIAQWFKNLRKKDFKSDAEEMKKEIEELSCEVVGGDINNFVKRRKFSRTVLYNEAKNKVCKPYAKF